MAQTVGNIWVEVPSTSAMGYNIARVYLCYSLKLSGDDPIFEGGSCICFCYLGTLRSQK